MKSWLVLILLIVAFYTTPQNSIAQEIDISKIPPGRYLVIGTFHIKQNALGFSDYVRKQGQYDPKLAYHPVKKYYYVYIKEYQPGEAGYDDVKRMRQSTEFIDSWFMIVEPYEWPPKELTSADSSKPATENTAANEVTNTGQQAASTSEDSDETAKDPRPADNEVSTGSWIKVSTGGNPTTEIDEENLEEDVPATYEEEGKYKMYFNTYYIKNYKEVKGPVEVIDPYSLKLLRVFQSLELVKVPDPKNKDHAVQLIANIFGYKKVQHDIKLDAPMDSINEEFIHFKGDTLIASFPLRRYDVGDIATMYNVYFFEDAVIMKPISRYELSTLVEMLKENPNLKIRIHGHTNGNKRGRMILLPEDSEKFFTLNQPVIEKTGSAKELSLKRAEIIKRYLMSFGISPERMEVIGWGGKKPIYDEMSKLAIKNVRVEIEILEN